MKKFFLLFFAFLGISQWASSQLVNTQANIDTTVVITFEKTIHDYGTIKQGGDGQCEFPFTNTGTNPLVLSNVRSSCGCTVAEWPKEPILPGKSSSIKVRYDTNRVGTIAKSITVTSNAKNSSVKLTIKGNVVAK